MNQSGLILMNYITACNLHLLYHHTGEFQCIIYYFFELKFAFSSMVALLHLHGN